MPVHIRAAITAALMVALGDASASQEINDPLPELAPEASADAISTPCCVVAAGSLVQIEIVDPVNSATATRGDVVRLRLTAPVLAGDTVLLPAGTPGLGEVIHAERARGGGKAGELLLAARHLDYADYRIPLRGMKLGGNGSHRAGAALAVAIAAGPVGMLVRGGNLEVPVGTLAEARLAQPLDPAALQRPSHSKSGSESGPRPTPPFPGSDVGMGDTHPAMGADSKPHTQQEQ